MNKNFFSSMVQFQMKYPNETFALAISGGADSMALLHWAALAGLNCVALTVDHKLRLESRAEAEHVSEICKKLGIQHNVLEWNGNKPETGIEEAARAARYDLMLAFCKKNNIGVLMTAHQADDTIETFLMNLGRGSGVYGLAGIREQTQRDGIIIFRPLLKVSRAELQKYCDYNDIKYFNDSMNEDESFLRVKIRKNRHILEKLNITDSRLLLAIDNLGRMRDYVESESARLIRTFGNEFDEMTLLSLPDELRFRILSMLLSADYPLRLNDIKNAFSKLDAGDCKFTLANYNIRKLNGKIRIWKEGTKWSKL